LINLCNRTEYSFRHAYGHLAKVIDANHDEYAGICDINGTWGHVPFEKACRKEGVKPIFGVELAVVPDPKLDEKQGVKYLRFIALTNNGLKQIYELVTFATEQFYYFPRISIGDIRSLTNEVAVITSWNFEPKDNLVYLDLNPTTRKQAIIGANKHGIKPLATSDNYFPRPEHKDAYEVCMGKFADDKTTPMHILTGDEYKEALKDVTDEEYISQALSNTIEIATMADVSLTRAELVSPVVTKTLKEMCYDAGLSRGVDLSDPIYKERLDRELSLIAEKEFEDYFFLIADLCQWAKKTMLVGPARGSSCGSLVCYLLNITEIDPIKYDLIFERFIDINRADLPDIDIDFPDVKRESVFNYLREKYGEACVAQLGTINRFKAKSAIGDCAKALGIPMYEVTNLKDAIIERSGGDARAAFCIMDTFKELDIGQKMLKKYPELQIAEEIEAHAKHSGKHAAGIVVTSKPVSWYCSVDRQTGAAQVDKYDAEELNLLKIDVLGLRTLSVIEDCLEQINWSNKDLLDFPLDSDKAFNVINEGKFSGIFQYEGYALQSLCRQFELEDFEDVISVTALARPGPLNSGMANDWIKRRTGVAEVTYEHPMLEDILKDSLGVVIYQENIMRIAREIGNMSWEDVSSLRKAVAKSLGVEFFNKYKEQFLKGAIENNFEEEQAAEFWDKICSFGSWSYNRSHAVAYGLISYWCMVLKSHYPLQYAAACLRHNGGGKAGEEKSIKFLRELVNEGYEYKAFDKDLSEENWSVQGGKLVGGIIGVKGFGPKTAGDIVLRRKEGRNLTGSQIKKMEEAVSPYDVIFECKEKWGHIFDNPVAHNIKSPLTFLKNITEKSDGRFVFIAKLIDKNQRDLNEVGFVEKRGGRLMRGQTLYLNFVVEDDTDSIICQIDRFNYMDYGKPIIESGKNGDWYIFKGRCRKGFRRVYVDRWKKLS